MFKALSVILLMATSLGAVTFTPVSPAPPGEVDLAVIVQQECPACVQVPVELDSTFPVPGFSPLLILAFEDLPIATSDNDFNDLVGWFDFYTQTFTAVASYSGDTHTVVPAGTFVLLFSDGKCCGTISFSTLATPRRHVAYGVPIPEVDPVPEPYSLSMLVPGLLFLGWRKYRR